MLLTYVEESFTARVYWIGALLVPAAAAIPLSEALDQVMASAAKTYGAPGDVERRRPLKSTGGTRESDTR